MFDTIINRARTYKIIEKEGHKIGYLCYTGYQEQSENDLVRVFTEFKSSGVSDVVLDLRYNPGGYSRTARTLGSILVRESAIRNRSVYLEHYYNESYSSYLKTGGYALNERFIDTLPVNMNLDRLYVLTGENTASASEATIVGLKPYLDVIMIGKTTSGKYCGGILLSPEDFYGKDNKQYYSGFLNWGMYIMIYRFVSVNGISSFTGGLAPDIPVDEGRYDLKPFGDEEDPLLGRALAHILGNSYVEKRSGALYQPLIRSERDFISLPAKSGGMLERPFKSPLQRGADR
jgi:C-terminal processing protease CtpA/Prc